MRGLRNIVVHEYFGVTNETLWKTAREDLPTIMSPCGSCSPRSSSPGVREMDIRWLLEEF
jgi:Protein of unknown function DUF86